MCLPSNGVMTEDFTAPQSPRLPLPSQVPHVSEHDMWLAELLLLSGLDLAVRRAQFVIRTAVRAQELAMKAETDPIDELLDARRFAKNSRSRTIYNRAISYLRAEQILSRQLRVGGGLRDSRL